GRPISVPPGAGAAPRDPAPAPPGLRGAGDRSPSRLVPRQLALHPDELGAVALALLVQPVRVDQPGRVVVRFGEDRRDVVGLSHNYATWVGFGCGHRFTWWAIWDSPGPSPAGAAPVPLSVPDVTSGFAFASAAIALPFKSASLPMKPFRSASRHSR